jgi:spore germination protein Q
MEQSYIENILRLNRGKRATVYMSFDGESSSYTPKVFTGIIEAAGRDHIILSDPQTGERYVLLMVYLNYVKFEGEIEYSYPIGQMATYSPR